MNKNNKVVKQIYELTLYGTTRHSFCSSKIKPVLND